MNFATARRNMVDCQLKTNCVVTPALLSAMGELPRERFVPTSMQEVAYIDEDIRISKGRFVMEPMVLARLLEACRVRKSDVVMVVSCGTGYSAAVTAMLASTVFAIERESKLCAWATRELTNLAMDNVVVIKGRADHGYPDQSPYDVILIDGAVSEVPKRIIDQLAEGGRLVTVVGGDKAVGQATLIQRHNDTVSARILFDASVRSLPSFGVKTEFVF